MNEQNMLMEVHDVENNVNYAGLRKVESQPKNLDEVRDDFTQPPQYNNNRSAKVSKKDPQSTQQSLNSTPPRHFSSKELQEKNYYNNQSVGNLPSLNDHNKGSNGYNNYQSKKYANQSSNNQNVSIMFIFGKFWGLFYIKI